MSDSEDTDIIWKYWTSPGKRKRKKSSKKEVKKGKNSATVTTAENSQKKKKKKNSKFKEAMTTKKIKKKEKKRKKKDPSALETNNGFTLTQLCDKREDAAEERESLTPCCKDKQTPELSQESKKKKIKKAKKVAFDLPLGYTRAKRPILQSPSVLRPEDSVAISSDGEVVRSSESVSQVPETGHSQEVTRHGDDSQSNSEDMNSQDIFITQKRFRASPAEASSSDLSNKFIIDTPQLFMQQEQQREEECPRDSPVQQLHRKKSEHRKRKRPDMVVTKEEEEEEGISENHSHEKEEESVHMQVEMSAEFTEQGKVSCAQHVKSPVVNPHLAQSQTCSYAAEQRLVTSTSTQTDNFFTSELSSYLSFCQKTAITFHPDDLKPLDLSLPQRATTCLSMKTSSVSPPSESELRSADTTASSEDNEPPSRSNKLDLTQVERKSKNSLVVSEEFDAHPAPQVEEDVDGNGDRQQQAVEAQTVAAGAALREVLIHCSRVEQTKERHDGDEPYHHRQQEHSGE
ncbi:uncharacterized protein V6R79_011035 [Siganus canaliculatus]